MTNEEFLAWLGRLSPEQRAMVEPLHQRIITVVHSNDALHMKMNLDLAGELADIRRHLAALVERCSASCTCSRADVDDGRCRHIG